MIDENLVGLHDIFSLVALHCEFAAFTSDFHDGIDHTPGLAKCCCIGLEEDRRTVEGSRTSEKGGNILAYLRCHDVCACQIFVRERVPTTSLAMRSEKEIRTFAAGGKTRTARAPCSFTVSRMNDMKESIASKSSPPEGLINTQWSVSAIDTDTLT